MKRCCRAASGPRTLAPPAVRVGLPSDYLWCSPLWCWTTVRSAVPSLHDCSGRVSRVKATPLRGRCASLDTSAAARGMAAIEGTGEKQGIVSVQVSPAGRAISVPLTPVIKGVSRSLTAPPRRRSADL
jgi:hypothetical protein